MTQSRLDNHAALPDAVRRPVYDRGALRIGICHIGLGAFHRAHQAVYTDLALGETKDLSWGIEAVSLRSSATARALTQQEGLYSVLVRSGETTTATVVGAVVSAISAAQEPPRLLERLASPATRVVSLTVTEKAYGLDPDTGDLDVSHPAVSADLLAPHAPRGAVGFLVAALRERRERGIPPFTVLCCDNLPQNGKVVRRLVTSFARRLDPALAEWIAREVAFPSSMVDRIVPAPTAVTRSDAHRILGVRDECAVETEPFMQWVIEDRFPAGRPRWDLAGALFVEDVEPYERMKLRLLNGAHSLIAYIGQNRGLMYVRDVMAVAEHRRRVRSYMADVALTLGQVPGIDLDGYMDSLISRFSNAAIRHATRQIAMDGTQKLPTRIFAPASEARQTGREACTYAGAAAEWMHYCCTTDQIDDPRREELHTAAGHSREMPEGAEPFLRIPGLFPKALREDQAWCRLVSEKLVALRKQLGA